MMYYFAFEAPFGFTFVQAKEAIAIACGMVRKSHKMKLILRHR